jgi:hypothetical protein
MQHRGYLFHRLAGVKSIGRGAKCFCKVPTDIGRKCRESCLRPDLYFSACTHCEYFHATAIDDVELYSALL